MKVKDAIKNIKNYVITKDGKILGINSINENTSDLEVEEIEIIEGVIEDITCIRI